MNQGINYFPLLFSSPPEQTRLCKLTAANGLDIPVLGCLQADVECLGKVFPGKCIFVLTDTSPDVKEMKGVSGIIGGECTQ